MSISDKLIAIAENEQKVFEAGKRTALKGSRHMNATASGAIVLCDSASPAFDMTVQLTSDTITDFSAVNVARYGKNLFRLQDFTVAGSSSATEVKDGVLTITYTRAVSTGTAVSETNMKNNFIGLSHYPAGTYTFLAEHIEHTGSGAVSYPYLEIELADGTLGRLDVNNPTDVTQSFTVNAIKFTSPASKVAGDVYTTPLQLVCGGVSDYEPFVEPSIYQAAENGAVQGIKGVLPNTTLVTDTDNVTIQCEFLRDIDTYIDSLTGGE